MPNLLKAQINSFQRRLKALIWLIALGITILLLRLIYLQVFAHEHFTTLSSNNRLRIEVIEPFRGKIYDTKQRIIADNIIEYKLIIDSKKTNLETINLIAKLINLPNNKKNTWLKQFKLKNPIFNKTPLSSKQRAILYTNLFRLPGIAIKPSFRRYYPFDHITTNVLGIIKPIKLTKTLYPRNQQQLPNSYGLSGIEKLFNKELSGQYGHKEIEVNAKNHWLRTTAIKPAKHGNSITLTIDAKLQSAITKAFGNKTGAVVAINPNNGAILALNSFPTYSANAFNTPKINKLMLTWQQNPEKPLFNRATLGLFPPASTLKPIFGLMGLHLNLITPKHKIYDTGKFQIPGSNHIYRDHGNHFHQWIDLPHAIAVSCDTYFYQLSLQLGINNIANIMHQFGFGTELTQDIITKSGVINTPSWKLKHKHEPWYGGDTIISGIGQGNMLATPLQLAHMAAILAKRGHGFKPHIIKAITTPSGTTYKTKIEPWQMLSINPQHYATIIDSMQMVIKGPYRHNTGWRFGKTKYSIAAKTGTAELYHRQDKSKKTTKRHLKDHALFIGFAPVKNPQIAIAILAEHEPSAVSMARKIFDAFFQLNPIEHNANL